MMIMQVVALGSRALTQNSTGAEDEVAAAWVVGVLLGGALLTLAVISASRLVRRERWRRDVSKLTEVRRKGSSSVDSP
jgi:hypothetical protein